MAYELSPEDKDFWRGLRYRPHYRVSEAARYAELPARTISYWFRGGKLGSLGIVRGVGLSYYQMVEIAFVATFRNLGVPLRQIQKVRDCAADALESDRPFAEYDWMIKGPQVLRDFAEVQGNGAVKRLIEVDKHGPAGWQETVAERFQQFDYEENLALVWHLRGRDHPVKIHAGIRHGHPSIKGLPTWVLKARWFSGETVTKIADDYDVHPDDVRAAWEFEGVEFDAVWWNS